MVQTVFRVFLVYLLVSLTLDQVLATSQNDNEINYLNMKNENFSKPLLKSLTEDSWCTSFMINESGFDAHLIHYHIGSSDNLVNLLDRTTTATSKLLSVAEAPILIAIMPEIEWELAANADGSRDFYIISGTKELPRDPTNRLSYSYYLWLKKDYSNLFNQILNKSIFIDITFMGIVSDVWWKPVIGFLGEGNLDEKFLLNFFTNKVGMHIAAARATEIRQIADKYRTYIPSPDNGIYIISYQNPP